MQAKKFDKIFKSALIEHESSTSGDSWSKMEKMLDRNQHSSKRGMAWRWVAACFALIFVSSVLYTSFNADPDASVELAKVESKFLPIQSDLSIDKLIVDPVIILDSKLIAAGYAEIRSKTETSTSSPLLEREEVNVIEEPNIKDDEVVENIQLVSTETKIKKRMPIRITYKRGNQIPQNRASLAQQANDTVKNGKIKRFFQDAKHDLENSSLWADVKDVKEKISKNSKEKNTQNSNNNP